MTKNNDSKSEFLQAIEAVEETSGLHVCVYIKPIFRPRNRPDLVDWQHQSHRSPFCEVVKLNTKMKSCGGHDSVRLVAEAEKRRQLFTNVCHAGIVEVIVPVYCMGQLVATIFAGPVVTPALERKGFKDVRRRVAGLGVDLDALEQAHGKAVRMSETRLLKIGHLLSLAGKNLADTLHYEQLDRQVIFGQYPHLEKALDYMESHADETVRETTIAKIAGLSSGHFSRVFKKLTGIPFTHYLAELRIRRAQHLLVETSMKVIDIAAAVGYSRHSYFTRRFRQVVGTTPLAFRKRVLGEAYAG